MILNQNYNRWELRVVTYLQQIFHFWFSVFYITFILTPFQALRISQAKMYKKRFTSAPRSSGRTEAQNWLAKNVGKCKNCKNVMKFSVKTYISFYQGFSRYYCIFQSMSNFPRSIWKECPFITKIMLKIFLVFGFCKNYYTMTNLARIVGNYKLAPQFWTASILAVQLALKN